MRPFKNHHKRNRSRGVQDRSFKRSNDINRANLEFGNRENGFRRKNNRNNGNFDKLIIKYNEIAREALSNGDKILSENYLQHADHFTRILNERDSFKKDKFSDGKSQNNMNAEEETTVEKENASTNQEEIIENSKNEIEENAKPSAEVN